MKLSERKRKILQYVVDDYITTAQPVSSKSITEKYMPDVSSATVRSELAGLEEMGFLSQLHTSSGRVPSVEAYKLYVSELMDKGKLTGKEIAVIKETFKNHTDNLEEVALNTVKVISELTDYTSVAMAKHNALDKVLKIDIFRHKPNLALLLVVTETTLIRDKFISIPENMTDGQIADASRMLNKLLNGKSLSEIGEVANTIKSEFQSYREIFDGVMMAIEDYIDNNKAQVVVDGEDKILNHPEYSDGEKVKNFLSIVSSKNKLAKLLNDENDNIEVNIKIGGEGDEKVPNGCSLVTATYSASGVNVGTYGVIGPLRMDYQKVVSVLEGVGKVLEDMLKNDKK